MKPEDLSDNNAILRDPEITLFTEGDTSKKDFSAESIPWMKAVSGRVNHIMGHTNNFEVDFFLTYQRPHFAKLINTGKAKEQK